MFQAEQIIILCCFLIGTGVTGKDLEAKLDEVHITLNKKILFRMNRFLRLLLQVFVSVRLLTTTRGLNEDDFDKISEFIHLAVTDFENNKDYIKSGVAEICNKYPLYE